MFDSWLNTLAFVAALGSGLIAGVFYAFSTFIMRALARLPAASGIAAMQAINVVVLNPLFLGVFLGTAGLSAVAAIIAVWKWSAAGTLYLLLGGLLYFFGTFVITIAFNVPLNNRLAAASPTDLAGEQLWAIYLKQWTLWNHIRTAAALAAMVMFILAYRNSI